MNANFSFKVANGMKPKRNNNHSGNANITKKKVIKN